MRAAYRIRISVCLVLLATGAVFTNRLDINMHSNRQRPISDCDIDSIEGSPQRHCWTFLRRTVRRFKRASSSS